MRPPKNNSVYFGTEKRLLTAAAKVFKRRHFLGAKATEISHAAGLAESSFYIHYHSLPDLIDKNETKLIKGMKKVVKQARRNDDNLEWAFRNILLYLRSYRDFLGIVAETDNISLPLQIIHPLKHLIVKKWNNYGKETNDKLFRMFEFMCMADFSVWYSEGFSIKTLMRHSRHLAYLANNTPRFFAQIYYK